MGDAWLWEANSNGIWAIIGIFVARRTYLGPKLLNKLSRELRTLTSLSSFENCIPKCDLSLLVNKETRTSLPSPAVVLEVPQCNLRTSMCDCTVWPDSAKIKKFTSLFPSDFKNVFVWQCTGKILSPGFEFYPKAVLFECKFRISRSDIVHVQSWPIGLQGVGSRIRWRQRLTSLKLQRVNAVYCTCKTWV